jgi:hypothetical protein
MRPCFSRATCLALALAATSAFAEEPASPPSLEQLLQTVLDENRELRSRLDALEDEMRSVRDDASSTRNAAAGGAPPRVDAAPLAELPAGSNARFQLLDVSVDTLSSVGTSSVPDDELADLQGGGHDPARRGFNLTNLELSMLGAVDPYLDGEGHLIYFIDPEGESQFELEEAFITTRMLPFGLEEQGLQLEFGQMFTEFGRINPEHPHAWDWQDQPVVLTRFFGGDGMRGVGTRVDWLLPAPWFSELSAGVQNAQGETMTSFLASEETFEERPIGGRPFDSQGTQSFDDLVYLLRLVNGFDLGETWAAQVGVSGLYGPNATGGAGRTWIYGADWVLKWTPLSSDRGWPFVTIEGELARRSYHADSFFGCVDPDTDPCTDPVSLDSETFTDWGGYLQALWGFRRGWSVGLRGEYATGNDDVYEPGSFYATRSQDPFRGNRVRISPLLVFQPSEFSRFRLQYNADNADFLTGDDDAQSVWIGVEFLIGSHPAHRF